MRRRRPHTPPDLPGPPRAPLTRALGPTGRPGARAGRSRGRRAPRRPERRRRTPPPRATAAARRGGPLRALARRRREPHGRLGPLALIRPSPRAAWPCPGRPGCAATAPPLPPPLQAARRPCAPRPVPRPALRAPWPRFRRATPPASRRRREPGPPRAACPWPCTGRPAARAGKTEEGGEQAWAPLHVGPGCQPPPPFYVFHFLILAETLKIHVNL